jgi:hypothetical protein
MVIRYFGRSEVFVAVVCAVGYLSIGLPITDAVFAAHVTAMILRLKDHVVGSNLGPDHIIKQAIVEEISLKRSHAREILFVPLLQQGTALVIVHRKIHSRIVCEQISKGDAGEKNRPRPRISNNKSKCS